MYLINLINDKINWIKNILFNSYIFELFIYMFCFAFNILFL